MGDYTVADCIAISKADPAGTWSMLNSLCEEDVYTFCCTQFNVGDGSFKFYLSVLFGGVVSFFYISNLVVLLKQDFVFRGKLLYFFLKADVCNILIIEQVQLAVEKSIIVIGENNAEV